MAIPDIEKPGSGKGGKKRNWKRKVALLERQVEQERHEQAAAAATANATITDLRRKNEALQE